jgi:hypothetical protein
MFICGDHTLSSAFLTGFAHTHSLEVPEKLVRRAIDERKWRNWQTHSLEVAAHARAWGFKSPSAHHVLKNLADLILTLFS